VILRRLEAQRRSRSLIWTALAALCLAAGAAFAQYSEESIQRAFLEGAQLLESGRYAAAEAIFRDLLKKTNAPRIKLELARTLYYQKKYREARELFNEVLYDPGTPWRVQDNIEAFVRAIEEAEGYVKFSLSLISDSNPRNITSQREFTIGGVPLKFIPPADNHKVNGFRYAMQGFQPVLPEQHLSGYFTASYLDYPGISLDRLTMDMGVVKGLDASGRVSARAGLEAGTFDNRLLYQFPYLGGVAVLSQSALHRISGELKIGKVKFPDFGYLDSDYRSASVSALRTLSPRLGVGLNASLERSDAAETPYSYTGVALGPSASWLIVEPAVLLKGELSVSTRRYAAIDPLFGEQRSDTRTRFEISAQSKEWRWKAYRPALILAIEKNRSNIEFYEYHKVNVSIALQ
jgi:outer membrane protein